MEEKRHSGIGWIDLVIIGVALFLGNVVENAVGLHDKVLSFLVFIVASVVLMLVGYFIKYQLFDREE